LRPANPLNNEQGFRAKSKPAFLHPANPLNDERIFGQKGNLWLNCLATSSDSSAFFQAYVHSISVSISFAAKFRALPGLQQPEPVE